MRYLLWRHARPLHHMRRHSRPLHHAGMLWRVARSKKTWISWWRIAWVWSRVSSRKAHAHSGRWRSGRWRGRSGLSWALRAALAALDIPGKDQIVAVWADPIAMLLHSLRWWASCGAAHATARKILTGLCAQGAGAGFGRLAPAALDIPCELQVAAGWAYPITVPGFLLVALLALSISQHRHRNTNCHSGCWLCQHTGAL